MPGGYHALAKDERCFCAAKVGSRPGLLWVIRVDWASAASPLVPRFRTLWAHWSFDAMGHFVWPGRAVQDGLPRSANVRAASMYQASEVEHLLLAIMGIRAHPGLATGQTSKGHYGTQSLGCAGQTVRPSFHSISQTRRESCLN